MADEQVSDEFAKGIVAAMDDKADAEPEKTEEGGEPAEGKKEPAGEDPIAQLASELKKLGVTPETAREAYRDLSSFQTIEGQREHWQKFIASDRGAELRSMFGREELARMLASPGGSEKVIQIAQEFGLKLPDAHEEELSPEAKALRETKQTMRQQQARLEALEREIQGTKQAVQARTTDEQRQAAYLDWAEAKPQLPKKAHAVIAKRAHDLARIDPGRYGSRDGFKRAADEAYSEMVSVASFFAPPKPPKSVRSEGGGVAGKSFDPSKLTFDQRVSLAAEDFAAAATESPEE